VTRQERRRLTRRQSKPGAVTGTITIKGGPRLSDGEIDRILSAARSTIAEVRAPFAPGVRLPRLG
jgi:hypothetical protein